ncbi:MAG TPA: DNA polymerase III subunit gamma/tau [Woeseiaceae bacterium]|nr:DNA polymerase III subunit gamma/tau [Woeseiaceae bacterium]
MPYTVLARAWRPTTFSELVGQEHVRSALTNALEMGRLHHALLFTGTRGVGKTSIARIVAKCLNCDVGVTSAPCSNCSPCRSIDAGAFMDLVEVDGASRTKVESVRDWIDDVQFPPTQGRYKIYLIDEVHMLSTHAFNALLKTLEEPPPNIIFLLATTDPQKLPATVISRCLRFDLVQLPVAKMVDRMRSVLRGEGIAFELAGLMAVAHTADGSMRDALSLLDQLISFGDGQVSEANARAMLGMIPRDRIVHLAELLSMHNVPALLGDARSLADLAPNYDHILHELAGLFVNIAIRQVTDEVDDDVRDALEVLDRLSQTYTAQDLHLYYQIAIIGRRDLSLALDAQAGFELTLLRMLAFRPGS